MIIEGDKLHGKIVEGANGVSYKDIVWCATENGLMMQRTVNNGVVVVSGAPPLRVVDDTNAATSPHPSFEDTQSAVIRWGADRGILEHSNARAQLLKSVAEFGELADAEAKDDLGGIVDGIGDVLVTLIMYATLRGLDVSNCLALSYDEIKDRKGKMVAGGTFVKEAQ